MAEEITFSESFRATRDAQNKFDYFFLGVILATLSLSFQTPKVDLPLQHKSLLIASWVLWLISFFSGMYRRERFNLFLFMETQSLEFKPKHELLIKAKRGEEVLFKAPYEMWEPEEIEKELKRTTERVNWVDKKQDKYNKQMLNAYKIKKWSYILGSITYISFWITNTI